MDTVDTRSASVPEDGEKIIEIQLERLRTFKNHPFKVRMDQEMIRLSASAEKYGIINPLIVRPIPDGVYEIISGHRRKAAAEKFGYRKVPVIIRVMSDDEAVINMVDSNLQRQQITFSEKAFAYKMKNEAMKRTGGRRKSSQSDYPLKGKKTVEIIGEEFGDSAKQVQRYLKLTDLIPELLEKLDNGELSFNPAVELSYLTIEEQKEFIDAMEYKEDYNLIYSAEMLPSDSLDGLYERFNIDRPRDFTGHSMSVGDIIVVNDEGNLTAYFVDSISFKELDQFINLEKVLPEKESEIPQKEEYKPLTKVEELEEQNYNMVDNVLNNGFGEKERREEIRKAAESYQQKTGATITFFAAVCEEFPSMGNYFDGLTVEQVTDRYKQILADPRLSYMGNGMGFELHDSSLPDYLDGPMTLIKGHTIYADNIDSISYYREHPLVLEAIQELRERFPDFKYFMTAQESRIFIRSI